MLARTVERLFAIGLFGKKKPPDVPVGPPEPMLMNRLQELTVNDAELYQSLAKTLFIEPKRINASLETALSQASEFEIKGDKIRAEVWYRIAGGIALFHGDVAGVRKYFDKASTMANGSRQEYKILSQRAEDAVSIAGKYYSNM